MRMGVGGRAGPSYRFAFSSQAHSSLSPAPVSLGTYTPSLMLTERPSRYTSFVRVRNRTSTSFGWGLAPISGRRLMVIFRGPITRSSGWVTSTASTFWARAWTAARRSSNPASGQPRRRIMDGVSRGKREDNRPGSYPVVRTAARLRAAREASPRMAIRGLSGSPPQSHRDVLRLQVGFEALVAQLAAQTRLLHPADGALRGARPRVIAPVRPRLQPLGHPPHHGDVVGEHVGRQAVLRVVGRRDHVVELREVEHRHHRGEWLLGENGRVRRE